MINKATYTLACLVVVMLVAIPSTASGLHNIGGQGGPSKSTTSNKAQPCDPNSNGTCSICVAQPNTPGCLSCSKSDCVDSATTPCSQSSCDFIGNYIDPAINVLSACLGLVAVISLILGGINYTTSEGDPQKTARAKSRIFNTIFAVIAYLFLYTFLQFLVPGGIFNRAG